MLRLSLNVLLTLIIQSKITGKGKIGNGRLLIKLLQTFTDSSGSESYGRKKDTSSGVMNYQYPLKFLFWKKEKLLKILIHASLAHKDAMLDAKRFIELNSNHSVLLPDLTRYQHIRDELGDDESFTLIKNRLTKENFSNVESCDALFILNPTHRGITNYIGGNSFMEMVIAFYLKKPIYLLNDIPEGMNITEEIKSLYPIVVHNMVLFLEELCKL